MRLLLVLVTVLSFQACAAQQKNIPQKQQHTAMKRFNARQFDEKKSGNSFEYKLPDGTFVEQKESAGKHYIEIIHEPKSQFSTYSLYDYNTKNLRTEGRQFYQFPIGIWRDYNDQGAVINETDYDKAFTFSVDDLIRKMKKADIDIVTPQNGLGVTRSERPKPTYTIVIPVSPAEDVANKFILVDGRDGRTISETIEERTKN